MDSTFLMLFGSTLLAVAFWNVGGWARMLSIMFALIALFALAFTCA